MRHKDLLIVNEHRFLIIFCIIHARKHRCFKVRRDI